jgi:hypothetical protein
VGAGSRRGNEAVDRTLNPSAKSLPALFEAERAIFRRLVLSAADAIIGSGRVRPRVESRMSRVHRTIQEGALPSLPDPTVRRQQLASAWNRGLASRTSGRSRPCRGRV